MGSATHLGVVESLREFREVPTVDLIEFDPTKVFLLYSRDCPEFMKVMSSLNQFLEKYNIK
ncbi:unnamed protein product, partial [Timema podura]|nr:unnamed protein product [Timema podura]